MTQTVPGPRLRRLLPQSSAGLVLTLILTSQLMVVLDATIVNVALHDIRTALGFSAENLSWVVNAYTLTFGGLLLLGARAGDLLGRRRVFLAGIGLFSVASLLGGFAQNPGELLAARAVQGVGGALASPSALALLMTMFPGARERTRAIGLYTAVSIGGAAVGLIAGGMLSQWVSWRWVLFVNAPIGAVLLLLGPVLVETPRRTGRFDIAGAVTSTLGMSAVVYGFVEAASKGWSDAETLGSFVFGVALLGTFVAVELRAESPITPLRLFADRRRSTSYLARLLLVAGMMGMFFFEAQNLRQVQGYSDLQTGLAFLPLTAVVFASSQLSARVLVERFGNYSVMVTSLAFSTTGMLTLAATGETRSYLQLAVALVIFGLGNGLAFVPLTTAALEGVNPSDAGAASGLVNVMQQLGGAVGLAVLVNIYGHASTSVLNHPHTGESASALGRRAFTEGAGHAIWFAVFFLAATWVLVAMLLRPRRAVAAWEPTDDLAASLESAAAHA
ncbi:MAG: MFS transporter [Jatrophihabitans sp.]|uniref:MFS transporter n=1 Tax=Jatrophihabitans sp. TaxID=1932789 RepID=UPI003F7E40E1